MRLVSFDNDRLGRVDGDVVVDVTPVVEIGDSTARLSPMRTLIERWESVAVDIAKYDGDQSPLSEVTLAAPIPDPSKILAAPVNYADHQREMSVDAHVSALGLFLKSPSSLLAPGGTVRLPYADRRFDQEGELAIVIGKEAYQLRGNAIDVVFGYTGLLDITMRGGEDRSTRKSFSTFTPMGPWIVTTDEFGDPNSIDLTCSVNGTVRQRANTKELIWGVEKLIEYASWISPLHPGDVLTTGTPAGVDELLDGDEISLVLDGLGEPLTARVSSEGAVASHTSGHGRGPRPPKSVRPGARF